jgi:hypothetical protein
VAADPIIEVSLGFILRFLGFLGASRVPLNSINRPVNTENHTEALGEELTAFSGLFFPFLFYYEDV